MTPREAALLLGAAIVGGVLNAIVGGGTFVAFPALVVARVPIVSANATTAFALWPGGVASALGYRKHLAKTRRLLPALLAVSLLGGGLGAWLLLTTSERVFEKLVPWLLLLATLCFTFGPTVTARLRASGPSRHALLVATVVQLAIAVYGGYFGGGMGILMLAAWSMLALGDIHALNALRNVLSIAINGVALVVFASAGAIAWKPGLVMVLGATAGGFGGAKLATRVPPSVMRRFVVAIAWGMTGYFFWRAMESQ